MSKTEQQCCELVSTPGFVGLFPCARTGKHIDEETGKSYCWQHLPKNAQKRNEEQRERWNREWAERTRKRDIEAATAEVANIAVKALHQEATYDDVMEAAAKLDRLREAKRDD